MRTDEQHEEQVTRYTTPEERENIAGIEIEAEDIDHFLELLRKGLVEAAAVHEAAVQENFGLSVESSIKLSRPVRNDEGEVVELEGEQKIEGRLRAHKVFNDLDGRPQD